MNNKPKRIQRRRVKGWRKPSTAVCVGRGSPWGNPFTVEQYGREKAIELYRQFLETMRETEPERYRELLKPLIGKDLACWCRTDESCHADVLLLLVAKLAKPQASVELAEGDNDV